LDFEVKKKKNLFFEEKKKENILAQSPVIALTITFPRLMDEG